MRGMSNLSKKLILISCVCLFLSGCGVLNTSKNSDQQESEYKVGDPNIPAPEEDIND
jgi:uncharacterized protein YceK